MAVGDDMMECSFSSLILDVVGSKQSGDVVSLGDLDWVLVTKEDLEWENSCLVSDRKKSEINWDSCLIENALMDRISCQPNSSNSLAAERYGPLGRAVDVVQIDEATEKNGDDHLIEVNTVTLGSRTKLGNALLPTCKDEKRGIEDSDTDMDLGFPPFDIFKVWDWPDWEIPSEEGELIKQLNKALSESLLQSTPPTFESLGDQISAGIAYLSLYQRSG